MSVCDNISMGHVGASHVYIGALGNSLGGGGAVYSLKSAPVVSGCIDKLLRSPLVFLSQ